MLIKDAHNILTPMNQVISDMNSKFIWSGDELVPGKRNLKNAVSGFCYIKHLKAYADGTPKSRKESNSIYPIGPDNWKRLVLWKVIETDHIGKYGATFWKLTNDGRHVLEAVEANDPYYRVMRWYDCSLDEMDLIKHVMNADLTNDEDCEIHVDIMPEGFIKMLDSIFNPESLCRKIGSSYKWINKIMHMLKTRDDFLKKMLDPEVMKWIDAHMEFDGMVNFKKHLLKIEKKQLKNANLDS